MKVCICCVKFSLFLFPGNRYSMYLAKIFLVKLIHHFEFGTSTKLSDLHFVNGISLKFGNSEIINFHIKKVERTDI